MLLVGISCLRLRVAQRFYRKISREEMAVSVLYKLESFEGPLDLLLHLIDKAEIDIHEVSINEITDQYMDYLNAMTEMELEVTSEFLVMAATLLAIKSRQLLPKPPVFEEEYEDWPDDGLDPRDELIQKLVEYRKFKQIAEQLREKETQRSLVFRVSRRT